MPSRDSTNASLLKKLLSVANTPDCVILWTQARATSLPLFWDISVTSLPPEHTWLSTLQNAHARKTVFKYMFIIFRETNERGRDEQAEKDERCEDDVLA